MKHAGVGFPNGAVDNARVFALPSLHLLMLSTEGRYHHDAAIRAGKRVLWRAIPRIGKRPAELGWSPSRFVAETINLTDAPTLPITDFVFANELDLNSERGDKEDDLDWSKFHDRYALIGGWALSVVQSLRQWSPRTRIHWPAWTPDHDAIMYADHWRAAADLCHVIDFHAYDSLDRIQNAYHDYRNEFPGKPLALTEWHCKGDLEEERRVLQWLAETMEADPLFEAAYFYIWRWWDHPGWWSDAWDIEHSPDRLALFMAPPVSTRVPDPEAPHMTRDEVIALIVSKARENGLVDWEFLGGAIAESALDPRARRPPNPSQDQAYWPDVSFGLFQQTARWADEGDQSMRGDNIRYIQDLYFDPVHACDVAARKFKAYRAQEATALDAWCRYNWPAQLPAQNPNRGNYANGLDEAKRLIGTTMTVTYNPNTPAILQDDNWSCAPTALRWALTSLGRNPGPNYIEDLLVKDGVVSKELGLLDASGAVLAAWIGRNEPADVYYGADGFYGNSEPSVTYNGVALEGDHQYPILIGGRAWNHWTGVRGYDEARNVLLLANPSPGWQGVGQEMTPEQFAALGPFSMVRVLHPDLSGVGTPVVVEPDPPVIVDPPKPADTRLERARVLAEQLLAVLGEPSPA